MGRFYYLLLSSRSVRHTPCTSPQRFGVFCSFNCITSIISHAYCTGWKCRDYLYSLGLRRRMIALTPAIAMAQRRETRHTRTREGECKQQTGDPMFVHVCGVDRPVFSRGGSPPERPPILQPLTTGIILQVYLSVLVRAYLLALD